MNSVVLFYNNTTAYLYYEHYNGFDLGDIATYLLKGLRAKF